jgi:copper chaperone
MQTKMQIEVDNLKCGGCARSILNGLSDLPNISNIEVDVEKHLIKFLGTEASRGLAAEKLLSMGYPEKGTITGLSAGVANAKSFVSCAIGRVS